jgi:5-methyltetrahydropteroyltriglutamate--homocysteine methyltransferase
MRKVFKASFASEQRTSRKEREVTTTDKRVYRAETVGSLRQPQELIDARAARAEDRITAEALQNIENEAVLNGIQVQENADVDVISDGEMHRASWAGARVYLDGFQAIEGASSSYPANVGQRQIGAVSAQGPLPQFSAVMERVRPRADAFLGEEFPFLRAHTDKPVKYTTAAPSYYRRYWSDQFSTGAGYGKCEDYLEDVRDWLRGVAERLIAQGCNYIQLDAPNYGSLCDPDNRAWHIAQGHDLDAQLAFDAELDSSVLDGLSVTSALHVCRGNGAAGNHSQGGYGVIAEGLFPKLRVDVALLEYDSDRAGDLDPIRHLRHETVAVLGLFTTKDATMEDLGMVETRVREAAGIKPLEELALSTQCGFASSTNAPMTDEEQEKKLTMVADVAHRIWQ